MNVTSSPAVEHLRSVIKDADLQLSMAEGFLIAPPAPNIMEQTVGMIEQATVPLHYAVHDPSLPFGMGAPAADGYRYLMNAQQSLQAALHGDMDMDEAQLSARNDVRTGHTLLKTAAAYPA